MLVTRFHCLFLIPTARTVFRKSHIFSPSYPAKSISSSLLKKVSTPPNLLSTFSSRRLLQSKQAKRIVENEADEWAELRKLGLFKRYQTIIKKYWYVAVPVHFATSALWFGAFYIAARCGIDVKPLLEYLKPTVENLPLPEIIKKPFTHPEESRHVGDIAVAIILYKVFLPVRYAATIALSGYSIRYLVRRGMIKPVPSRHKIKKAIQESGLKRVISDRISRRSLGINKQKLKKKPPR